MTGAVNNQQPDWQSFFKQSMTLPSVSWTAWPADQPQQRQLPTRTSEAIALEGQGYEAWLTTLFPSYATYPLGNHHRAVWEWAWGIEQQQRPAPMVLVLTRGGAKSTTAELITVAIGARGLRKFALYVCATQAQADDHVQNIAGMLESATVETHYPALTERAVSKYGNSKGWRRSRLRTASGFTVDAIGLDTTARGVRLDEYRPDLIIFDDIDGELDTLATTEKKIEQITKKILPAEGEHAAVLAIQNLIISDGVFARLADGRADFLQDREVIGPIPALENFSYEQRNDGRFYITSGEPTWAGQDVERCQQIIWTSGLTSFLVEYQHDTENPTGSMFSHLHYQRCRLEDVPELVRIVCWCDPAVTNTDKSDSQAIIIGGLGVDSKVYRLWCWEQRSTPQATLRLALQKAVFYKAECVGVETDQGGDTWISVYNEAWKSLIEDGTLPAAAARPAFREAKAGSGHGPKAHRGNQMLAAYEQGQIVHVEGTHVTLEKSLKRFLVKKPFDLVDAAYWEWFDLTGGNPPQGPPVADKHDIREAVRQGLRGQPRPTIQQQQRSSPAVAQAPNYRRGLR